MRGMMTGTLLGGMALGMLASGCHGNKIEGSLGTHEFGDIGTAYLSVTNDSSGTLTPLIIMVDTAWSCEQVQLLFSSLDQETLPSSLYTDGVVGGIVYVLGKVNSDATDSAGSTEPGDYVVYDIAADVTPAANSLFSIGIGLVGQVDADLSDVKAFVSHGGIITVDSYEAGKTMNGDFDIQMENEDNAISTFKGEFSLEPCNITLPDNSDADALTGPAWSHPLRQALRTRSLTR